MQGRDRRGERNLTRFMMEGKNNICKKRNNSVGMLAEKYVGDEGWKKVDEGFR